MRKTNYSYETSLPAYRENDAYSKQRQCDELLKFILRGAKCLLQLSELSGIVQSTVSARMKNLQDEGKASYNGNVIYRDRKRKKIVVTQPPVISIGKQGNIFE